jgi:hypothetical protein
MPTTEIDASPTKEFFISMLVKDIVLGRSILDLCDNCVDGARRIRPSGNFHSLYIRIELSETHFKIADNCGGIRSDIARDYAFRFGRPQNMEKTTHSVGQFGVGMKRSLFKIGTSFRIESRACNSHFVVKEDVNIWKNRPDWKFEFETIEENLPDQPEGDRGTTLLIDKLHDDIAAEFKLENFQNRLISDIEGAHQQSIKQGLAITLNAIPVKLKTSELFDSDQIQPANKVLMFQEEGKKPVTVKITCGVSIPDPSSAGWHIYCNGRLVLGPDQSNITGWGEGNGNTIPKYHNTHARFRGYVFFDSDDASRLPWNTTKTGVDYESRYYQAVRLEMIKLMRPVIDFNNGLAAEINSDNKPLEAALEQALQKDVSALPVRDVFKAIQLPSPPVNPTGRIQYTRPLEEIKKVKASLGVSSYREVGEKTFEYYFTAECNE